MANHEMRKKKLARDRAFAELVYGRIFLRTGGVVRAWTAMIANVNRLRFLVSSALRKTRLCLTAFPLPVCRKLALLADDHIIVAGRSLCLEGPIGSRLTRGQHQGPSTQSFKRTPFGSQMDETWYNFHRPFDWRCLSYYFLYCRM